LAEQEEKRKPAGFKADFKIHQIKNSQILNYRMPSIK
jgi:hypothetical protein